MANRDMIFLFLIGQHASHGSRSGARLCRLTDGRWGECLSTLAAYLKSNPINIPLRVRVSDTVWKWKCATRSKCQINLEHNSDNK